MQRCLAGHIPLANCPVTAEQPHAAFCIQCKLREVVVPLVDVFRQRLVDIAYGHLPIRAVEDRHTSSTVVVEAGPLHIRQESGVLAPVHAALVVGGPQAIAGVDRQRHVRFVQFGCGDGPDITPLGTVPRPEQNVVVALVIGVPCDVDLAILTGGDHRLPIIGRRA